MTPAAAVALVGIGLLAVGGEVVLLPPSPAAAPGAPALSVRAAGARGDGVNDDTRAVQATIDAAPDGAIIYFPPGTYLVNNFRVQGRAGLRFTGAGSRSILRRSPLPGNTRIATFADSTDITISHLTFDANGIERFGGMNFYGCRRVRIEHTRFLDGRPRGSGREDRYAYVFGRGRMPSEEVSILNNQIEDLQVEVDHARRVRIEGNTVVRAFRTAAIGIFTPGDGAIAEDYTIAGNTAVDPLGVAFAVHIDPPTSARASFRRIRIVGNTVVRRARAGRAVTVGIVDNSIASEGSVFDGISLEGNVVLMDPGLVDPRAEGGILFFNAGVRSGVIFRRSTVSRNRLNGTGALAQWGIDLRFLQDSVVAHNVVMGLRRGISIDSGRRTTLQENSVEASAVAYQFVRSRGENTIRGNRVLGTPRRRWRLDQVRPSDTLDVNGTP
jgi:hypothetical protein